MAKKGRGKLSGNQFERDWARKISLLLTNNLRDDCVWRTSNSGGKATVTGSDTQCSDLHAVRPEAQKFFDTFLVELKNYKASAINLLHFDRKNCIIYTWWKKARFEATKSNTRPLLIFNAKRLGIYFILSLKDLEYLQSIKAIKSPESPLPCIVINPKKDYYDETLMIFSIDEFQEVIDFSTFYLNITGILKIR